MRKVFWGYRNGEIVKFHIADMSDDDPYTVQSLCGRAATSRDDWNTLDWYREIWQEAAEGDESIGMPPDDTPFPPLCKKCLNVEAIRAACHGAVLIAS